MTCGGTEADCAPGTCYEGACPGDRIWSTDGTCGPSYGGRHCAGVWGDCCSLSGECGTGAGYCDTGNCYSGECDDFPTAAPTSSAPPSSTSSSVPSASATPPLVVDAYRMLGCFHDNPSRRVLYDHMDQHMSALTLEACKEYCVNDRGTPFFGVEYGVECYCGWDTDRYVQRAASEDECDMPCAGDSGQICGADQRINIFGPEDTPEHVWQGCRTDTDPAGPVLDARSFPSSSMSNELCEAQCTAWGPFDYFGTEAGSTCRCGDSFRTSSRPAPLSDCNIRCLGDTSHDCGGQNRITAFGPNRLQPTPIYQGYFTDDDPIEYALADIQTWNPTSNTPEECGWYCLYEGYSLFGLTFSHGCYCGNWLHHDSTQVAQSECNYLCSGDNIQTCGGNWRMAFYRWDWSKYYGSPPASFARGSAASGPETLDRTGLKPSVPVYTAMPEKNKALGPPPLG